MSKHKPTLKQQSKVTVQCRSQEHLFGNFSATCYHGGLMELFCF